MRNLVEALEVLQKCQFPNKAAGKVMVIIFGNMQCFI